jgi:hypothetical protein
MVNGLKQTQQCLRCINAAWPRAILVLVCAMVLAGSGSAAERRENTKTGMWIWQQEQSGFSIEFVQLHGDYVSAVFGSKGFTPEMLEKLSEYCFFGTVVRNSGQGPVTMRVADWFARTPDGRDQPLKTKTEWIADWASAGVPFKWLMLADDVTFEPGDWLQGFSSVKLARGSRFDLHYSWTVEGQRHEAVIADVECPPVHLPPR